MLQWPAGSTSTGSTCGSPPSAEGAEGGLWLPAAQSAPPEIRPNQAARLAVAIVSWNTRDLLRQALRTALAELPGEVVVVDNGSVDGTITMMREEFPSVPLEVLPSNPGYGAASNIAFTRCSAEYVLLLNSDVEVCPGAFEALVDYLDRHPRAAVVAPRLHNPDGSLQRSCFPFPDPFLLLFKREPLATLLGLLPWARDRYPGKWAHDSDRRVPWTVGAAMCFRRQAYEAVRGFTESYVMYYEEVDLCYRLKQAGWETHFTPRARIMHVGAASTRQRRRDMLLQLTLSSVEFHRQHHRGPVLLVALVLTWILAFGRLIRDSLRYRLSRGTVARARLAEDIAVWREVLVRTSSAA